MSLSGCAGSAARALLAAVVCVASSPKPMLLTRLTLGAAVRPPWYQRLAIQG